MNDGEKRVEFECPFCAGRVDANAELDPPTVFHSMPPCQRFIDLEADDFLSVARITIQGQTTIILKPGETWTPDRECMTLQLGGFMADWVPTQPGYAIKNSTESDVMLLVDFGEAIR